MKEKTPKELHNERLGLKFSNDFIFGKVIGKPDIAKEFLSVLLGMKLDDLHRVETQKTMKRTYRSKGVRFDAFIEDSKQLVDVECQVGSYDGLARRAAYYRSEISIDALEKSEKYSSMKEVYVLFVCKTDPFGDGEPVYTCETTARENGRVVNDGQHTIFYNCSAWWKVGNPDKRALMRFFYDDTATSAFTREMSNMADEAKFEDDDFTEYYADLRAKIHVLLEKQEALEESWAKGIAEGRAAGLAKGRAEGLEEGRVKGMAEGLAEGKAAGLEKGRTEGMAEARKSAWEKIQNLGLDSETLKKVQSVFV